MNKMMMIAILMGLTIALSAWSPVALADDYEAAKTNPAGLSFGNSAGLAYQGYYDEDGVLSRVHTLFVNFDNLAYVYDKQDHFDQHLIALSTNVARNFYLGLSWDWINSEFKYGEPTYSALFRPHNMLSFAAKTRDEVSQFGVALRPFVAHNFLNNRFSISADIVYDEDWLKPMIGLQTELVDGINIGGVYNMENEAFGLNFGISFGKLNIGTKSTFDSDNSLSYGKNFAHFSDRTFRNILSGRPKELFYDFKIPSRIVDKQPKHIIGPFEIVSGEEQTLEELIEELETLQYDDNVCGIVIKSGNFSTNFANILELRDAVSRFKAEGKKVVFYYENIGNINYTFAASIADEIYLNPLGSVDLRGVSLSVPYLKETLEALGIKVYNFRSHDYKSGANIFTESAMTEAERENFGMLLDVYFDYMVEMISSGRGERLTASAEDIINDGPYLSASKALECGLIDGIIYEDELNDKLNNIKVVENIVRTDARYDWYDPPKHQIAVIYAIGGINTGEGQPGRSIGSETMAKAIKEAREDSQIKGIVIRVDSGGGSALASDIINREVEKCREAGKPVVISMGGAAASGGYYISANADYIVAQPTTLTGSIGVLGMLFNMEEAFDRLKINWDTLKRGEQADLGALYREVSPKEKDIINHSIVEVYDMFIDVVARGRAMNRDEVHQYAQGKVWSGYHALEYGLIDELGGMDIALDKMSELAKLTHEIELVEYPKTKHRFTINVDSMPPFMNMMLISPQIPEELDKLFDIADMMMKFRNERFWFISPYQVTIE